MIRRILATKVQMLAEKFPVVTLTGPRQSGKTTLVKNAFPSYEYVSLEDPNVLSWATDDPVAFLDRYASNTIFDEAQRFPELFSYAQRRIDERNQPGQYIITGSQNFQLIKTISQSLAGRVAVLRLPPFSYEELARTGKAPHTIDDWILQGAYPRMYDTSIDPTDYYPSYVETYIERDIRQELGVVKIAEFERFLTLCALRSGELLNVADLSRDCGVSNKTAREWLSALEASDIIHFVQPYYANQGKRLIKTPKLYFWDTGLACNLMGIETVNDLIESKQRGALFETAVMAEVAKYHLFRERKPKLSFWRDTNGNEVDLVIEKGLQVIRAFGIKSSKTMNTRYFDMIEKIAAQDLELARNRYSVIYGGSETVQTSRGRMLCFADIALELAAAGL